MANTQLGQHWLRDPASLSAVIEAAGVKAQDTVLEVGPGQGTLTELLVGEAKRVISVEVDPKLARDLQQQLQADNLTVINGDILQFDLSDMPDSYKVAANVPYYITSPIINKFLLSDFPPVQLGLLVQKEVAQRLGAAPGDLSILGVSVQALAEVKLKQVVPANLFQPQPKVDSQIVCLKPFARSRFEDHEAVMQLVKAGFLNRRKTLVNSLSSTLQFSKEHLERVCRELNLTPNIRAQALTLDEWMRLYKRLYG